MTEKDNFGCREVAGTVARITVEGTIIGLAYLANPAVGVLAVFGAMVYEGRGAIKKKLQSWDQKFMNTLGE